MKKRPQASARPARKGRASDRAALRAGAHLPGALFATALRVKSEGVLIAQTRGKDREPKILFGNDSLCAMVGRKSADLAGQGQGLLHADPAEVQRLQGWLASAKPGESLTGDGFLRRPDGTTLSASWVIDPIFGSRGRLTHLVATYRDQTERRQMQEMLVHAQRLDAVGRLAGGVAHDFNNLISVINGYCEMLAARVVTNPQAMREVSEIHQAGRKAAALTQQLLAFSRRQPFNARSINLNTLAEENAEILRRLVGSAGALEFDLAPNLPNTRTDPAQFQQVLLNLVLNARDALRDRGRIVVSTSWRDLGSDQHRRVTDLRPGRYVILSVADNGTGMDAETQRHLFEPFFTTKPEGKGTGLGLALVYGVVQQSAGDITVRSAVLVGSTFEILLPATTEPAEESAPPVAPLPTTRGNEMITFVEDDDVVRKMVEGILTADGYRVTAAKHFRDLEREAATARPPQLLAATPSAEAERFGRAALARNPDLRLLWIRQSEGCPRAVAWVPANRQGTLQKPYALSELLRAARKILDA